MSQLKSPVWRILLGGPSYRMEVDARHSASLVPFALRLAMPRMVQRKAFGGRMRDVVTPSPFVVIGTAYEHGTPVALARNGLFRTALESEADVLLWLDSDCSIPMEQIDPIIRAMLLWLAPSAPERPLLGVPAPQRDRRANVWTSREDKLTRLDLDGAVHPCFAVGFGCVAFRLGWYRREWPTAPWFRDSWDESMASYVGEDYGHCRALAERDPHGPCYAGAYVDHHDRGEGKSLAADQPRTVVAGG